MASKTLAPKRKKDRDLTTELIKEAALIIFSKVGFDKATTKAISEKAGVAEALIIRYFGSKKGLLFALTKEYVDQIELMDYDFPIQETLEDELEKQLLFGLKKILYSKKIFKVVMVHSLLNEQFNKELKETIPQKSPSPKVLERLNHFRKRGAISDKISNEEILADLTIQLMGHFLLAQPIMGLASEVSEGFLARGARIYARGLKD